MRQKAFTLIELLVVIAIIALLLSIIMPALSRIKESSYRVICSTNVRSQVTGVRLYAEQNNGSIPENENGFWFQDLTFWCSNQIMEFSGVDYRSFDCPANKIKSTADSRLWQFTWVGDGDYQPAAPGTISGPLELRDESRLNETRQRQEYRVMEYTYLFDRMNTSVNPPVSMYAGRNLLNGMKPIWISKITNLKNSSATVMVADNILSAGGATAASGYTDAPAAGCNFTEIAGGLYTMYGMYDSANHLSRQTDGNTDRRDVSGGVVGYADGHVIWKKRSDITCQIQFGQYFWW